jgi:NUMOD3 motif
METIYTRKCPVCSKELITTNKYFYNKAVSKNSKCLSCALKGKPKSDKAKKNMSSHHADVSGKHNPFYGKQHTEETKKKLSVLNVGVDRYSDEEKKRRSVMYSGRGNPFYGKHHTEEAKNKLAQPKSAEHLEHLRQAAYLRRGIPNSKEQKEKIRKKLTGRVFTKNHLIKMSPARKGDPRTKTRLGIHNSAEHNRKIRMSHIKRRNLLFGGSDGVMYPNVGDREGEYFKQLEIERGWNGIYYNKSKKQMYIEGTGYFVDYYEPSLNIVVEYDETHHYDANWNLRDKDVQRQDEIKNVLHCAFFRYNEKLKKFYEV